MNILTDALGTPAVQHTARFPMTSNFQYVCMTPSIGLVLTADYRKIPLIKYGVTQNHWRKSANYSPTSAEGRWLVFLGQKTRRHLRQGLSLSTSPVLTSWASSLSTHNPPSTAHRATTLSMDGAPVMATYTRRCVGSSADVCLINPLMFSFQAYLEFFVSPAGLASLLAQIESDPNMTYHAINKRGDLRTNTHSEGPNAVTWGVFPGKEIAQPTVVEAVSFMAWKVRTPSPLKHPRFANKPPTGRSLPARHAMGTYVRTNLPNTPALGLHHGNLLPRQCRQ